ncbi:tRNA-splicing endonuclease subunit sen54 N-term-domain-containing protein [Neohortaea acidophila]|uniref:tRNA-splicing endonuclease subunit sen54 N-term-domain-containing protein n=1 Tax=Neohortaea acidophila TaxID=245834 RepID=A0A6A6PSB5_9PEZI|nr:tRNA-splicing endonuclease subunit sen54 N-term-domain-containing protein [Neohortaea acidophila]KAF2482989.1 tRNA-splicing endonuclease subunit sen54 N-term-domain-containing protein [Neohortaea acidophila]
MADVDEDAFTPSAPGGGEDQDLGDEVQDFRFLASISREDASIPKRGDKDFEPHGTALQSNILTASRQAMHNALSYQRMHQPKNHVVAHYHPETNMAYVPNPKGIHFTKVGSVLSAKHDPLGDDERRGQRLWLLPEETLLLLERGVLDVRWPVDLDDEGDEGLPMSLQGAYAMFIGDGETDTSSLTLERYLVYSNLKRTGYTVQRAASWNSNGPPLGPECFAPRSGRTWDVGLLETARWWYLLLSAKEETAPAEQRVGPLVPNRLYRGYPEIYRRLALINYYNPTRQHIQDPEFSLYPQLPRTEDLRVTYNIWKPNSPTFKKSAPGPPDFRIAVVNAREVDIPSLEQLDALLETTPYDPPKDTAQLYQKLKYGYKNVILAIVDQGIVSYLRFGDAAFGLEHLYERQRGGPGGKRGRGGGRGRGGRGGRGGR